MSHAFEDELVNDTLETPFHEVSLCGNKVGDSLQCPIEANLWIGARNVHAVGHYDSQHNSYVQIRGFKEFILAPRRQQGICTYTHDRISGTTDN